MSADELAITVKIPEGAKRLLVRIPYGSNAPTFEPSEVTVDFKDTESGGDGIWTPAELTGTDVVTRVIQ